MVLRIVMHFAEQPKARGGELVNELRRGDEPLRARVPNALLPHLIVGRYGGPTRRHRPHQEERGQKRCAAH